MAPGKDYGDPKAGLCASCRHVKINRSDRGAVFYYCRKSETDRRFPKYPPLPLLHCGGYEPAPS